MTSQTIKMEVCVDSIASALAAAKGGASRIELCSALNEGGLSPSVGVLKALKSQLTNIPIFCMLRPRRGNDFQYSDLEMEAILYDIELFMSHGCDGFCFGALDDQCCVAKDRCREVIKKAGSLPVTFHRAFDLTPIEQMHKTVEVIKDLQFERILTSGFKQTSEEGIDILAELLSQHKDIIIMPGTGITTSNLYKILNTTKCAEFHASARITNVSPAISSVVSMGTRDTVPYYGTDISIVCEMIKICQNINNM